ncbi:GrrA/OscA1 family cyclophane-containing rSAM-modified RiPP [Terriglobus sp.]|uniref:GrrA/OscA1 family cyclophane-containing rSAM-modified RiPP n=1 Tax=Terriglobus sp. TaxID=1889013 RepID=UPI003B008F8C
MSATKRTSAALALLIPTGVVGISSALAITQNRAMKGVEQNGSVADRLSQIRRAVSENLHIGANKTAVNPAGVELTLAEWLNFGGGLGWHNGGWGNGWHNGGWGNGWHNGGWGNGGWGNGGWGNGWHNYWHNW